MIIVRIWEGLGNQLFQYAYARGIKERLNVEVLLDNTHVNRGDISGEIFSINRRYCLDKFNISLNLSQKNIDLDQMNILTDENNNLFCMNYLLDPEDGTYISANCISSLYFNDYERIIREELTLKVEPNISSELIKLMNEYVPVSVHIRLTDYLDIPSNMLRQTYYDIAFKYILKHVENPVFLIFTDDYNCAKNKYIVPDNSYWVYQERLENYEELWLMTKCNHNIIAASTFSFWGAWLNQHKDKIVIASKKWGGRESYEDNWVLL